LQLIPKDVIHQVEATKILGQNRPHVSQLPGSTAASANMLNLAKGLCAMVLPDVSALIRDQGGATEAPGGSPKPQAEYPPMINSKDFAPFVKSNGDKEMWLNICTQFSPPVVRVYGMRNVGNQENPTWTGYIKAMYYADGSTSGDPASVGTKLAYPANAPVLDHNEVVRNGVTRDNYYPACIQDPNYPMPGDNANHAPDDVVAFYRSRFGMIPFCPPAFLAGGGLMWEKDVSDPDQADAQVDNVKEWTLRGAISAGMSVFAYLRTADLTHNTSVYYNQCQLLP
jgi:hypothetical protein